MNSVRCFVLILWECFLRTSRLFTSVTAVLRGREWICGGSVNRSSYKGFGWRKNVCRRSWKKLIEAQRGQQGSSRRQSIIVSSSNFTDEAGASWRKLEGVEEFRLRRTRRTWIPSNVRRAYWFVYSYTSEKYAVTDAFGTEMTHW